MPPAKSKTAAPLPPAALPTMPALDLVDQAEDFDDDEDDPQDENHLMNILYKLKNAKNTLDSSRQKYVVSCSFIRYCSVHDGLLRFYRKKAKQLIEQTSVRFASDADDVVSKHHKRWAAKFGAVSIATFARREIADPISLPTCSCSRKCRNSSPQRRRR